MSRWTTTGGDVVEVYASATRCLRTECTTAHREFRYRVRAVNGEIIEQWSEGYTRKSAAIQAAERHHPRVEVAHVHGAWCHPSADGCPDDVR